MTHPFHPWSGREFEFVAVRRTWEQDRVFFFDEQGTQRSLPRAWTDAASQKLLEEPPVRLTVVTKSI